MREARFGLYHHDCWVCRATEKHSDISLAQVSCSQIGAHNDKFLRHGIFGVSASSPSALSEFMKTVGRQPAIRRADIIEADGTQALAYFKWVTDASPDDLLAGKGCVLIGESVENGCESYHVVNPEASMLSEAIEQVKGIGVLKVKRLGEYKKPKHRKATEKQMQALRLAVSSDYYAFPRKARLSELSAAAGISKAAFHKLLRRAEANFIPARVFEKQ